MPESLTVRTAQTDIFVQRWGAGPPILLLHGFPETHLMWRDVAPLLARDFTVICADLRGYGRSSCPPSASNHSPYSKRVLANDMVAVMDQLGSSRFSIAGHDRGGRVAYRLALDHAARVERLAVLDIVPTSVAWDRANARFALGFWPWSLLSQPEPLPERILACAAEAIVDDAARNWGSAAHAFPADVRAAYADALHDPAHAHAICEEYRAAASIERNHDEADRRAGRKIACPLLVLWASGGSLDRWYADEGGPLALWREWAEDVQGESVGAGHFFPEEIPDETTRRLRDFFIGDRQRRRADAVTIGRASP